MSPLRTILLCALAALSTAACGGFAPCGHSRSVDVGGTLSVAAVPGTTPPPGYSTAGLPARIDLGVGPIFESNVEGRPGLFRDLWGTLMEGTSLGAGQGMALTLEGIIPARERTTARAVLVLPTPLRQGARYPVTRAFPVPIGLHNPEVYATRYLGREPLRRTGEAEVALFYGHTQFVAPDPFAQEIPEFVAATVAGSVEVLSDRGRELRLRVDLTVADSAGRPLRMQGEIRAAGEVRTKPCIS